MQNGNQAMGEGAQGGFDWSQVGEEGMSLGNNLSQVVSQNN